MWLTAGIVRRIVRLDELGEFILDDLVLVLVLHHVDPLLAHWQMAAGDWADDLEFAFLVRRAWVVGGAYLRACPIIQEEQLVREKLLHDPLVRRLQPLRDLCVGLHNVHIRVQIRPDNLADHLTRDAGR